MCIAIYLLIVSVYRLHAWYNHSTASSPSVTSTRVLILPVFCWTKWTLVSFLADMGWQVFLWFRAGWGGVGWDNRLQERMMLCSGTLSWMSANMSCNAEDVLRQCMEWDAVGWVGESVHVCLRECVILRSDMLSWTSATLKMTPRECFKPEKQFWLLVRRKDGKMPSWIFSIWGDCEPTVVCVYIYIYIY